MIKLSDTPVATSLASGDNIFINRNGAIMQVARNELFNNTMSAPPIVPTVSGNVIPLTDSSDRPFVDLTVFGSTTQNGTPTPTAPVDLVSVENPVVTINGKNLVENTATTKTVNGVTFTVNSDGTVTANGTTSENATASIRTCDSITLPIGTYILSGCPSGGGSTTYDIRYSASGGRDTGSGTTITITEPTEIYVAILIRSGVTVDNLVFKPMIRLASISDSTYEPYKAQSISIPYTLNEGDYVDFEKGVFVQKCAKFIVDENTTIHSVAAIGAYARVTITITNEPSLPVSVASSLCNIAPFASGYSSDTLHHYSDGNFIRIFVPIAELTSQDAEGAKAWLISKGAYFVYALATPTETPLTAEEIEAFKQLQSYYPVTTITNSENAEMSVNYVADTKNYIDNKLASLVASASATDTTEV